MPTQPPSFAAVSGRFAANGHENDAISSMVLERQVTDRFQIRRWTSMAISKPFDPLVSGRKLLERKTKRVTHVWIAKTTCDLTQPFGIAGTGE
jgi:hypothetical protein